MLIDDIRNGESPTLEFKRDIQVALYDDRLEIVSPGGLPRDMTIQRMMSGCSRCRNKAIAEAFAYMRVAEKWGRGIPNAMHAFAEYGLQAPEYTDWGNAVKVTVRRIPKKREVEQGKGDVALNEVVEPNKSGEGNGRVALNVASKVALNERLVALVKAEPGINRGQIAQKLDVTTRTIDRIIAALDEVVVRRGSKKTGGYYLKEQD